jgi:hypothetical protein
MSERFIGIENIQKMIDQNDIDKVEIKSTFIDDSKVIKKSSHKDFYSDILESITEFSKKFPHTQFATIIQEDKISKKISLLVKPIHGTA